MSLKDPLNKMSKSDPSDLSRINLMDTPETIELKIKRATTDPINEFYIDQKHRPGITNLANIYSELNDITLEEVEKKFQGVSLKEFKDALTNSIIQEISPITERINDITSEIEGIEDVLTRGQSQAFDEAEANLLRVKDAMDLLI